MKSKSNPFLIIGYESKKYFCDRKKELELLHKNIQNRCNLTLISARRLGKSALIRRFFEDLEEENYTGIYVDIYSTNSLKDFTEELALAIFKRFPEKQSTGKRFMNFLKGFRPIFTYDSLNGQPEIHFDYVQPREYEHTLRSLLTFIDNQNISVVLAIDEFQQIADYPEQNVEALLRTIIQTLRNTQFVFSGSKKSMMLEMFNTANRPFFSSTQIMGLTEIPTNEYRAFIHEKFTENNRSITDEAVYFILSWTLSHTYYTQIICNSVFAEKEKNITMRNVKQACDEQLDMQHTTFMQYKSLLSPVQWKLLLAIAKEGLVTEPQAQHFLQKHKIGAASSAKKALEALIDKEMVCTVETADSVAFRVYNVFLMRWLERVW
ncbi:MAG: AAA family ATPase [Tannerella sp.]|jgi:AAA+ ATPase superfamily predicted ATPase|nr:AAA family ATPase [Tannerella sp.]